MNKNTWLPLLAAVLPAAGHATAGHGDFAVVVTAPRPERTWAQVAKEEMDAALPGTTPLGLLARLPGASHTGSEDFGAYEWGNDLAVRGFTAGQVGWMLDDIPLGSTHYWYNGGLDLHRAISTENLQSLTLVPGSGSTELASYSALGAGIVAASDDPAAARGGRVRLTAGSHDAWRGFARADSGVAAGGGSGFVSLATLTSDKWKGMGGPGQRPFAIFDRDDGDAVTGAGGRWGNYHDQWNAKWVQPLGPHRLTFYGNVSDKRENDYADLTVADYRRLGPETDNWTHWADALAGDETVYFGSAMSWRRDLLLAATLDLDLAGAGRLTLTPYHHKDEGNGDWHMPDVDDGAVTEVVFRRSRLDLRRTGVNLRWQLRHGGHRLGAGLWLETRRFDRQRHAYALEDWRRGPEVDFGTVAATLIDRRYDTHTRQFWVQDRYTPAGSRWTFSAGGKLLHVVNDFHDRQGVYADHRLTTRSALLPAFGASYRLARTQELFASLSANINAKPETVFTQAVYDDGFAPEKSRTFEAGWRHGSERIALAVAAYAIDYRNRLLQIANCSLLGTCPSLLANVGRVSSRGVEARWRADLGAHWSWTGSAAYNDARYRNDYLVRGATVATAGKRVVNAPDWLLFAELRYARDGWHAGLEAQHRGRRAASYTNDLTIPAVTLWHASGGWEQAGGPLGARRSGMQWQVRNLFDKSYIATIGASGYFASDADGTSTYVQAGAPRGVYVTVFADF